MSKLPSDLTHGQKKNSMAKVMVVDDEATLTILLRNHLADIGHQVVGIAYSGEECLELVWAVKPDLILMDIKLSGKLDGIATAKLIREGSDIPIIFLTAYTDDDLFERAKQADPFGYIVKPYHPRELEITIEVALHRKAAERQLKSYQDHLEMIVGERTAELSRTNEKLENKVIQHQQAEAALRESEEKYRLLVENLQEGIWVIDQHANTTFVNPRMAEMLGYSPAEMVGRHLFSFMDRSNIEHCQHYLERRQKCVREQHDFVFVRKNGSHFFAILDASPLIDDQGNYTGAIACVTDITDRIRAERSLRESEERYRRLFNGAVLGIFQSAPDGQLINANPAYATMFGYASPMEMLSTVHDITVDPDADPPRRPEIIRLILDADQPIQITNQYRRRDGNTFTGSLQAWQVTDADGQLLYLEGFIEDISERQLIEDERKHQFHFLQTLIDAIPSPVFYKDTDGRYLGINRAFEDYIGLSKDKLLGRTVYDVAPSDLAERYHEMDQALFNRPGTQEYEAIVRYADGQHHNVIFNKATFFDINGRLAGLVGVITDISERKRVEEELDKYRENLEELVKQRTAELAHANAILKAEIAERKRTEEALRKNEAEQRARATELEAAKELIKDSLKEKEMLLKEIHHRVKNNLQVIIGLLNITRDQTSNPEATELLTDASVRVHSMALIHSQLYQSTYLSKISMEIYAEQLVANISQTYLPRSVSLIVAPSDVFLEIDQAIPCALVLNELITNVYKHAFRGKDQGTIEVAISTEADDLVQVRVKDDGVGLPPDFDPAKPKSLGFELIRGLVRQLRGTLTINICGGTEMIVRFPPRSKEEHHHLF
ncbi:MAG: PAS domain S-box protein [Deltaproteobacteria bacterium]|nr:PAS domain S-box protein [Deltaproteobacteria bacterium]